jgi:hypothetical protein
MKEKTLQEKLVNCHILLSNGIDINEINYLLIKRGFIINDTIFHKHTGEMFIVKKLLETLIEVENEFSKSIIIDDSEIYLTKYEMRDIKINKMING